MQRIRKGNDFVFLWTITNRGVPEDLINATNLKLVRYVGAFGYGGQEIPCQALDNGELRVEVTPQMAPTSGKYYFELSYEREDATLSDQDRKVEVDVDAFRIVERTEKAEEIFTIREATDTLIALRGKPMRWKDLTDEQKYEVKRASIEAAQRADIATSNANSATSSAITATDNANRATTNANTAAENANAKATLANTAATNANAKATLAGQKATLADTAATNANNKATLANNAATNANTKATLASTAASNADTAAGRANTATSNANTAASNANTAAEGATLAKDSANTAANLANNKASLAADKAALANTAAGSANNAATNANAKATLANTAAENANTKAGEANTAAQNANTKATLANNAAASASDAATLAGNKATLADTAAASANNAASEATTQATYAETQGDYAKAEAENIPAMVADKSGHEEEKTVAQALSELNAKIKALEAVVANKTVERLTVASKFELYGDTNLILIGEGAPAVTPDFIGQRYIDTVGRVAYTAFNTSNAGGWA